MKMIENLNISELKKVLKWLNKYSLLRKNLWKRWEKLFKRWLSGKPYLLVEFTSSISKDLAFEEAFKVYVKTFNIKPEKVDVELMPTDTISWWIRVYFDDDMVDLSYNRVETKIKNNLNY